MDIGFLGTFCTLSSPRHRFVVAFVDSCYKAFMPFVFGEEVQVQNLDP